MSGGGSSSLFEKMSGREPNVLPYGFGSARGKVVAELSQQAGRD
jgi:hypothetical protein